MKDSRLITDASFQGSIQPDPTTGKERFYLTARVNQPVPGKPKSPARGGSGR
jgi:general secretion pathway protein L